MASGSHKVEQLGFARDRAVFIYPQPASNILLQKCGWVSEMNPVNSSCVLLIYILFSKRSKNQTIACKWNYKSAAHWILKRTNLAATLGPSNKFGPDPTNQ
ncbi:unnamed protein product [Clavelina lepadiformis]|uniref:Uncharacterized protein n=1 Tax=Clavelina lepadiformis TaxID=159417 RepID=A0ABP0GF64_CLALP